ncbi:hypothetical protein IT084_12155 [Desulfallas sp. Bu1-1]|uniref:methyl-accepting chemotaxis protein n=1 Tax=Desulfallas sp. Bu1-1 TaxID=2787620 RepID=UPI00189D8B4A|nr:methyl-accepting chemotaxis protein [Desulfallas sp. Bu1-1]MBF7083725.1 hypothetical protein [Desulfallas sp. Bu1-1]
MKTLREKMTILVLSFGFVVLAASWGGWWYDGKSPWGLVLGGLTGLLLSTAACYVLFTPLHRNLLHVLDTTEKAIRGDLTGTIENKNYGWGEFNLLINNIRRILKGVHKWFALVKDTSVTLDRAAGQITAGTGQVSTGSQDQAEQVTKLLQAIEILAGQAGDCARQAGEADISVRSAAETTGRGSVSVRKVAENMNLLEQKFEQLKSSSNRIAQFLEVIQDIAARTNLLALNAAIEAARAGEHGRGFAVVADEVRSLAANAEKATGEVSQIVSEILAAVEDTVQAVQTSLACSREAEQLFGDINQILNEAGSLAGEIARIAREQAQSTSDMLSAAQSIAAVAQQAAASSQETAAVAQELTVTADSLKKVADIWKFE